jgi:hypothetical protein
MEFAFIRFPTFFLRDNIANRRKIDEEKSYKNLIYYSIDIRVLKMYFIHYI